MMRFRRTDIVPIVLCGLGVCGAAVALALGIMLGLLGTLELAVSAAAFAVLIVEKMKR